MLFFEARARARESHKVGLVRCAGQRVVGPRAVLQGNGKPNWNAVVKFKRGYEGRRIFTAQVRFRFSRI